MKRGKCNNTISSTVIRDIVSRFISSIKTWFIISISFGSVNTVFAQDSADGERNLKRHEISLSLGVASFLHGGDDHADSYFFNHFGTGRDKNDRVFGGLRMVSVDFGYFYNMDGNWSLGGYYGASANGDFGYTIECEEGYVKGDLNRVARYVIPSIRHFWNAPSKRYRFYSGVSLGLLSERVEFEADECDFSARGFSKGSTISKTRTGTTFHATFIGVTSTHRKWSSFFELGFGCRGMLIGGIKYAW